MNGPSKKRGGGQTEAISGTSALHVQENVNLKLLDSRIQRTLELLHSSTRRKVQFTEIAVQVHLSSSHFRHLFRKQTGMSPSRYVKLLRLKSARELLETTFLSVKEVSSAAGLSDLSHFVRDYKAEYGESPSQTRISTRKIKNAQPVRKIR